MSVGVLVLQTKTITQVTSWTIGEEFTCTPGPIATAKLFMVAATMCGTTMNYIIFTTINIKTMKTYIGTKQVKAEPMDELAAVEKGYARKNEDNHEWRQGYHVQYANPDGSTYDSWSPKDVFERSYNVCDEEQIAMVCFPLTNRSINKAVSLLTIGGADDKTLEEVAAKMENLKKKGFAIVPSKIYNTGDEGQQFEMMVPLLALGISL